MNTNLIQSCVVAFLKAQSAVVAKLSSSGEIKEDQWQGTTFLYPAVRVDVGDQTPIGAGDNCTASKTPVSIPCFSEQASSMETNDLAWEIVQALDGKTFIQVTSLGKLRLSSIRIESLGAAKRINERTWQSIVRFLMIVEPA